jgi:hypothetical protein
LRTGFGCLIIVGVGIVVFPMGLAISLGGGESAWKKVAGIM